MVGLVVLLHGAPALVESAARFPVAWLHASFADYIMQTGDLATGVDARFSWPGFFTAASALTQAVGAPSARVWLLWTPTAMVLACIPLLVGIGRATLTNWRAIWTGTAVFVIANWVGQDYFAPQAVSLVLYLAILTLLLSHLRAPRRGALGRRPSPGMEPIAGGLVGRLREACSPELDPVEVGASETTRVGLIIAVAAGVLAVAASHQLTPVILVVTLAALAAIGRLRPWPLALFAAVGAVAWLCVVAEPFWFGHSADIFGSLGRIDRITRARPDRADRRLGDALDGCGVEDQVLAPRVGAGRRRNRGGYPPPSAQRPAAGPRGSTEHHDPRRATTAVRGSCGCTSSRWWGPACSSGR